MAGRGRKTAIVLLVIVGILAGLLVVADRLGVYLAEKTLAEQAAKELKSRSITSATEPDVSIGGFPFLTQVLGGTYDQVTIAVDQPEAGTVKLDKLTVVATGVHAPIEVVTSQRGQVTADRVTGTASMGWDAVRSLLELAGLPGLDLSGVQLNVVDNQVRLRAPVAVAGQRVFVVVTGALAAANGKLKLEINSFAVEGAQLPSGISGQLQQRFSAEFRVPALPYRLTVNKVETSSAGLLLTASADNVVLAG